MKEVKISLIVITKNSEKTLEFCLNSVGELFPEVILVDDCSTDKTIEIAQKYQAKIFQKELKSFGVQKQFALDQATGQWIFLIDSDEVATAELVQEIEHVIAQSVSLNAYKIMRRNFYFGKWLRFGGKHPDWQVRLFKRGTVQFSENIVHEKVIVNGRVGHLENQINHFSYPDLNTWLQKLKMFSEFRAEELYRKGKRPSPFNFFQFCVLRPVWRFDKRFFLKLGFLDGLPGLLAAIHDVLTEILTYLLLSQKCKKR